MRMYRPKRRDLEIAPEDIILDDTNLSDFNRSRFEGRLETPLSSGTFLVLSGCVALLLMALFGRAWVLQGIKGPAFAEQSARNSLTVAPVFAPRGVITDRYGAVLADNVAAPDGTMERRYPVPSLSHVLGYVSYPQKDSKGIYYNTHETGVTGLEAEYDALLAGENGQVLTETDAFGTVRSQGMLVPPREGQSLRLTIDTELQNALADSVAGIARSIHFIAGAAVVMDISSGEIRAFVSYPSYDSAVLTRGGPAATISGYSTDPGRPFLDHVVQGVYVPGSIVKPLVSAGALSDGVISPSTIITDSGSLSIDDPYHPGKKYVYTGWRALGPVDVKRAIAWSSDIFFYTVGGGYESQKGLGIDRLGYWYRQFGLGTTTGVGLAGEASGLVPSPAWKQKTFNESWYLGDTYFTAIGQYAMQVTPIQMVRAIAAVANGGTLLTPTLLPQSVKKAGTVPVSDETLSIVRAGMRLSVTGALAKALDFPYVSVAAKTGTAQTGARNQYDNSWVVGFFPYEHPQYAFAVVLERGPQGAGEQSVNVMARMFDTLHAEGSPYAGGTGTTTARGR